MPIKLSTQIFRSDHYDSLKFVINSWLKDNPKLQIESIKESLININGKIIREIRIDYYEEG